jgi:hypothetical protein
MILLVWKFAQMHQNTFLNTPDGQKYLFWKKSFWLSGSMCKCIKTRFWWSLSMCKCITFLTTQDGKKYLYWKKVTGGLEVCANASKYVFKHSWRSKKSFLKKCFWWSGNVRKCMQTHFKHSRRSKISFLKKKFLVVWKQMHQNTFLTTPDGKKYLFWKKVTGGLEACANASKHVFGGL